MAWGKQILVNRLGREKNNCWPHCFFAWILFTLSQSAAVAADLPVRVIAVLPEKGSAIIEHLSGDALPLGTKYRVVLLPEHRDIVTIDAVTQSGEKQNMYSASALRDVDGLELPAANAWYTLTAAGDTRLIVTQKNAIYEHLIRGVDATLEARQPLTWSPKPPKINAVPTITIAHTDISEILEKIGAYRSVILKLASADDPTFRGGPGAKVFREAAPGVVLIVTDQGFGSGIVISQRGEVLTNWHVIDGAKSIAIVLKPPAGQQLRPTDVVDGRILRYDQVADLALIQFVQPPPYVVPLRLGDDRTVEVGSPVHAIGHPEGQDWTYTQGIISQLRVDYRWISEDKVQHAASVIQTQTPINSGNSGGPLLDDNVDVIGINSFRLPGTEGINFAVAVGEIKRFLNAPGIVWQRPLPRLLRHSRPALLRVVSLGVFVITLIQQTARRSFRLIPGAWVEPISTFMVSERMGRPNTR
jgi:S1-C subfamily serine protease